MITYIFLIFTLLLLLSIAYRRFNHDLLSPTVISCSVFCFSVLLAIIGLLSWNDQSVLNSYSLIIYITGLSAFFCGEIVARKIYTKKHPSKKKTSYKIRFIDINRYLYVGTIFFIILTITLLILEIKRVCSAYGFEANSLPELLASYRSKSPLFSASMLQGGTDINFIVKQMKKIIDVLSLIFTYLTINNFLYEKDAKSKLITLIKFAAPVILCCAASLLTSGRSLLMHILVTAVMTALLYVYQVHQTKIRQLNRKIIIVLAMVICISLAGFYAILPLVGRSAGNSKFVDYISFYLGTPLPSLNSKTSSLKKNANDLPGEKTFTNVYYTLNHYKLIKYTKPSASDWTRHGNFSSNVYSSFYPMYYDFGIIGVLILQFGFGLCISYIYLNVRYQKNRLLFIIYCFYSYILIDQIRGEAFYSLLSSSTIVYIVLIAIAYSVYIRHITKKDIEASKKSFNNLKDRYLKHA